MTFPIHTERLSIRPFVAGEGGDLFAVFAAPEVMRHWNSAPPRDEAEADEWAEHLADMQARFGFAQWRVARRDDDRLVGVAGLQPLEGGPEVELTYALHPAAWGAGYATEAARAVLRFAFEHARLDEVVGIAREANHPSRRVMLKAGMRCVGPATYFGSAWIKYVLTREEWAAATRPGPASAEARAPVLPLLTARLALRPFVPADLESLLPIFGDPAVMRFVGAGRRPLDEERLAESQERVLAHWRDHGYGPLAVVERATGRLIGEAGLQLLEDGPEVEVTYTLARDAWGRGYATEAAGAVLAWGFDRLGLERIVAVAYPQNLASRRVMAKLGMRPAGEQRCYGAVLVKSALTAAEWRAGGRPAPG